MIAMIMVMFAVETMKDGCYSEMDTDGIHPLLVVTLMGKKDDHVW